MMSESKKLSNFSLLFLGLTLFVLSIGAPWYDGYPFYSLLIMDMREYKIHMLAVLYPILLSIFLFIYKNESCRNFKFGISQFLLILFFLISSISLFWSDNHQLFLSKWFIYFFGFIAFYYSFKIHHSQRNYIIIATLLSLAAILVSFIGIAQYLYEVPVLNILPQTAAPASTFGNKNIANQFIVFLFPAVFYILIKNTTKVQFLIGTIAFNSIIFYVYYGETKAAWLAILFESLLVFLYYLFNKKHLPKVRVNLFKISLFIAVFTSFVALDLNSNNSSILGDSKFNNVTNELSARYQDSNAERIKIWEKTINIGNTSKIYGHGLGSALNEFSQDGYFVKLTDSHNDVLELYLELGLIGILIFIIFIISLIRDWKFIYQNTSKNNSLFIHLLMISLCGAFVDSMFSFPLQTIHGVTIALVFAALILSKKNLISSEVVVINYNPLLGRVLNFSVVLMCFYALYLTNNWTSSRSNFYLHSGLLGSPINIDKIQKNLNFPDRDKLLLQAARSSSTNNDFDNANNLFSIIVKNNPAHMLALYQKYQYLLERKMYNKARDVLTQMLALNKMHPLTFKSLIDFFYKQGDIAKAKRHFSQYKEYYESLDYKDNRAYRFLHYWSIVLKEFQDTENLYKVYVQNFGLKVVVEDTMANYYFHTEQFEKCVPHVKYVLQHKKDIIKFDLLNSLIQKGLIKDDM
jgi:O-antigen ligase